MVIFTHVRFIMNVRFDLFVCVWGGQYLNIPTSSIKTLCQAIVSKGIAAPTEVALGIGEWVWRKKGQKRIKKQTWVICNSCHWIPTMIFLYSC